MFHVSKVRYIDIVFKSFSLQKSSVLFCLLFIHTALSAQQKDVWNAVNNQKGKITKSAQKQKSLIKSWQQQIEEWGTNDTYKNELSLGLNLHTNGLGGQARWLINKGGSSKNLWLLNVNSIKHEKEIKQQKNGDYYRDLGSFKPYVFGKVNSVLHLQFGYGKEQVLLPAIINENMTVSGSFVIGASVIVQKPVYLKLIYTDTSGAPFIQSEKYTSNNESIFLTNTRILGADKWTKGLGDSKIIPGLFIEPALVFTSAKNKMFIQRICIGGNLSYHLQPVEILALHKGKSFNASFFVGIGLGKRW